MVQVSSEGHDGTEALAVAMNVSMQAGHSIHALYEHALYSGNSSGASNQVFDIGGTGSGADFISGDTYSGTDISVTGDALLRNPEFFVDQDGDGVYTDGEFWDDRHISFNSGTNWPYQFLGPVSSNIMAMYLSDGDFSEAYGNNKHDFGEMFVDSIGNGVYDTTGSFVDLDGNGVFSSGDTFSDFNSNGVWDAGEEFTDLGNGVYDGGEAYQDLNGNGQWDDAIFGEWVPPVPGEWHSSPWGGGYWDPEEQPGYWTSETPAEPFEDEGNGVWDSGEEYVDGNGIYDDGELFVDDRNGLYDYGTETPGVATGIPVPSNTGLVHAVGGDMPIDPPNLTNMFYQISNTNVAPSGASFGWGHDFDVAAQSLNMAGHIMDQNNPAHIFVKNPSDRWYTPIPGKNDYFIEDPTDSTFSGSGISIPNPSGGSLTMRLLTVNENGNGKVYYVDGNVYLHNPVTHVYQFRDSGTFMTIIANGNITISDEFYYNGGVGDPLDMLCLIAMKDPSHPSDSGNIYLGDAQFGTGGEIHSMLYAESDFVDNNLDTSGQPYLSVFGNMTAGNHIVIDRSSPGRTRLDISLDERIRKRGRTPPGLPPPLGNQRGIVLDSIWAEVSGSWDAFSPL